MADVVEVAVGWMWELADIGRKVCCTAESLDGSYKAETGVQRTGVMYMLT